MAKVEYTLTINRPVDEVFGFVTDFRNNPKWQADVVDVRQSDGKTRVGTMVTETRRLRVLLYRFDMNADVIEYRLNRKLEYKGVLGQFGFTATYSFEPAGISTRLTETLDVRIWGLHRLFGGFIERGLQRRSERVLNNLKKQLESGAFVQIR